MLLAGSNGSGKSTIFDVLSLLKRFLTRQRATGEVFAGDSITRWDSRNKQTFELTVESEGQDFDYRLVVEHDLDRSQSRVFHERLTAGDTLLYSMRILRPICIGTTVLADRLFQRIGRARSSQRSAIDPTSKTWFAFAIECAGFICLRPIRFE